MMRNFLLRTLCFLLLVLLIKNIAMGETRNAWRNKKHKEILVFRNVKGKNLATPRRIRDDAG